jgi:hypothetical protein
VPNPLFPSIDELNRRLTINSREERRLRTLLKLALEAQDDSAKFGTVNQRPRPNVSRHSRQEGPSRGT